MSGIEDKDLVPVRHQDELRVGMAVVLRGCRGHRKNCLMILLEKFPDRSGLHGSFDTRRDEPCSWPWALSTTHMGDATCFCLPIKEGRLFRLRDLDDDEEEIEAAVRAKIAERQR